MPRRCVQILALFGYKYLTLVHQNYFGAPQQVVNGIVTAVSHFKSIYATPISHRSCLQHSHVTVQKVAAIDTTEIPDSKLFAFFKGLNDADVNGVLSTELADGLPAGVYRFCSV